jgi:hypothetical protein
MAKRAPKKKKPLLNTSGFLTNTPENSYWNTGTVTAATTTLSGTSTYSYTYDPANSTYSINIPTTFIGYNTTATTTATISTTPSWSTTNLSEYYVTRDADGVIRPLYGGSTTNLDTFYDPNVTDIGEVSIDFNTGEVKVDGVTELNPTKIGRAILKAMEQYRKDDLTDPKEFFN